MEFVDGGSVLQWLQTASRSVSEIVGAFVQAGRGLAAAHAADIVHRDFKPENALTDRQGRVRVADFGLAHLCNDDPAAPDLRGKLPGTTSYMAPEHRAGRACDARADQYSFCVALFEALYHRFPDPPPLDPPRRSAAGGPVDPAIRRVLARGLQHAPEDRFATMDALLTALSPPRSRAPMVPLLVVAGATGIGVLWALRDAQPPCDGAFELAASWHDQRRSEVAAALSEVDVPYAAASATTVSHRLDALATAWVEERKAACRAAAAEGAHAGGVTAARITCLGRVRQRFEALVEQLVVADAAAVRRAVEAANALPHPDDCDRPRGLAEPAVADDPRNLAREDTAFAELAHVIALQDTGRRDAAAQRLEGLLRELDDAPSPRARIQAEQQAGLLAQARGEFSSASEHYENALVEAVRIRDAESIVGAAALAATTLSGVRERDMAKARLMLRLARSAAPPGELHPVVRARLGNAEVVLLRADAQYEEAIRAATETIERIEGERGPTSYSLVALLRTRAIVSEQAGRFDDALADILRAAEIARDALGEDHPEMAGLAEVRSTLLASLGRFDEAVSASENARNVFALTDGPTAQSTTRVEEALAMLLLRRADTTDGPDLQRAYKLLRELARRLEALPGEPSVGYANVRDMLAKVHRALRQPERALEDVDAAIAVYERVDGEDAPSLGVPLTTRALILLDLHRPGEAVEAARRAVQLLHAAAPRHPSVLAARHILLVALHAADDPRALRDTAIEARSAAEQLQGPRSAFVANADFHLGLAEARLEHWDAAIEALRRAESLLAAQGDRTPGLADVELVLAGVLCHAGQADASRRSAARLLETWDGESRYGTRGEAQALAAGTCPVRPPLKAR
jgi:tetratricopeptide (TPR) repeat protein